MSIQPAPTQTEPESTPTQPASRPSHSASARAPRTFSNRTDRLQNLIDEYNAAFATDGTR